MDLKLFDLDDEYPDGDPVEENYAAPPAPAPAGGGGGGATPSPLEEQAAMLRELATLCMEVARLTGRRVLAAEMAAAEVQAQAQALPPSYVAPPYPAVATPEPTPSAAAFGLPADPHLAFHRATRAVRMSVGLWRQLEREKDIDAAKAAQRRLDDRRAGASDRRARIEAVVEAVAHDHFETALPGETNDYDAMEAWTVVCGEARERLDADIYGDLTAAPLSEMVARICRDVALTPDWPSLAREPWARAEIAATRGGAHPVGAPLADFVDQPELPDPPTGRLEVDFVNPPRPPKPKPRAESIRWRRRHAPPGERPDPPLKVVFVSPPEHPGGPMIEHENSRDAKDWPADLVPPAPPSRSPSRSPSPPRNAPMDIANPWLD